MLKLLRKKGVAKKLIWVIAIVIIISFGFLGTAYLITGSGGVSDAGKIFGKKVSIEDFNKVYQNARIQAVRQYGYNLNKVAHLLNLEAQTWDRLILLHEAKKRKIKISNNEIITEIERDESFRKNNQFDVLLYNTILRNLQIRPRDYEENIRDNLKITKLFQQETASVVLNEDDVLKEYQNRNEKIQTSYIFVASETFKNDVTIETSEIEKYYQDNKSEFLASPTVNVQYLTLDYPELDEGVENVESKTADSKNQDIDLEKDVIREKADDLFQKLLINPNMAEIAAQNNLSVQTTGFFSKEQPNFTLGWSYDLLNKIFQMSVNEVREPFETTTGLSIIQIKEKRESHIPEFSEAQEKVSESLIIQKAKEIANTKTFEYLEALKEELNKSKLWDFPKAAKALELEIHQTPVFSRGQYLPQIGISKDFQESAFQLTENSKLSDVVETEKGYCILHLDNYIPVDMSEYEEAKEELAQSISMEKRNTLFGDFVMQLRLKADIVDNISKLRSQTQ